MRLIAGVFDALKKPSPLRSPQERGGKPQTLDHRYSGIRVLFVTLALIAVAACGLLSAARTSAAADGQAIADITSLPAASKHALVVGISRYDAGRRLNPLNYSDDDARDFARFLESGLGFPRANIQLFHDSEGVAPPDLPTYEQLSRAHEGLVSRINSDSVVFVFYSGHGFRARGAGGEREDYWVTADAKLPDTRLCLSHTGLLKSLEAKRPRRLLVFFDACRNPLDGPNSVAPDGAIPSKAIYAEGKGAGVPFPEPEDLSAPIPQGGVLFSCQKGQLSREIPSLKRGAFTYHLLRGLQDRSAADGSGVVSFQRLLEYVRGRVHEEVLGVSDLQDPCGSSDPTDLALTKLPPLLPTERESLLVAALARAEEAKGLKQETAARDFAQEALGLAGLDAPGWAAEARYLLAQHFHRKRDMQTAFREVKSALAADPNHLRARLLASEIAPQQNDEWPRLSTGLTGPRKLAASAMEAAIAGRPDQAERDIGLALQAHSGDPDLLAAQAIVLAERADYSGAFAAYKKGLAGGTTLAGASAHQEILIAVLHRAEAARLLSAADAEDAAMRPPAAIEHLRQAVELLPQDFAPHLKLAAVLQRAGKTSEALLLGVEARRLSPNSADVDALLRSALDEIPQSSPENLIKRGENELPQDPQSASRLAAEAIARGAGAPGWRLLGEARRRIAGTAGPANAARWSRSAATALAEAIRLQPDEPARQLLRSVYAESAVRRGLTLLMQDRVPEARRQAELASEQNPDNADCWALLAYTSMRIGADYKGAAAKLSQLAPGEAVAPVVHLARGSMLLQGKEPESAQRELEAAVRTDPSFALAWNDLGMIYRLRRKRREAQTAYENAIKASPDYAVPWSGLGAVHLERNAEARQARDKSGATAEAVRAAQAYRTAARMRANYGAFWAWLAVAEQRAGNSAEARVAAKRARDLGVFRHEAFNLVKL